MNAVVSSIMLKAAPRQMMSHGFSTDSSIVHHRYSNPLIKIPQSSSSITTPLHPQHAPPDQPTHHPQRHLRPPKPRPHQPPLPLLLLLTQIPHRIHHPGHTPRHAHPRAQHRILESADQQAGEKGRVVFHVVGVRALRAVEEVFVARGLRVRFRGVGGWVGELGRFAVKAGVEAVPLAQEGGGCGGEEDVACGGGGG